MRARCALIYADIEFQLREIELRSKPRSMLTLSPKGTVPVLYTHDHQVIDQSLDIMYWALAQHDPDHWLPELNSSQKEKMDDWIAMNDGPFKKLLDQYKYPERYPHITKHDSLENAVHLFLQPLDQQLENTQFLLSNSITMLDIAVFPFVRQFTSVSPRQFESLSLNHLNQWLNFFIVSDLFRKVMEKYPVWKENEV